MKHSDYLKKKKTRETRKKIISVISAIVVFITTYALVLPAITLDVSKASQEPGIAFEQMQFKTTASAASVTAADSTVEVQVDEAQVEEPEAEAPAEEEVIQEEPAESSEEETSAVSDEQEEAPAEPEQEETPAEPEQEEAPAAKTETEEVQEDRSTDSKSDEAPSSEPAQEEAQAADTQKTAEQTAVDQAGTEETDAAASATTEETAAEFQIPTLDALDFDDILTGKTAFYYYHPENAEEAENLSSDSVDDWKKAGSDTVLAPEDFVRVYISYEIPAGALNETNTVARYRLPADLELSDKQIKAINKYENGIAASRSGSEHDKYLGAEAIEGSRTPDEEAGDEYISATVKVEETGNGRQELVFTFIPYTVEKNQISYDEKGNVKSKGREVKGFFTFDLTTSQINFENTEKENVEKEDGTTEEIQHSKAEVVFADKDGDRIERRLTMAAPVENQEPQAQEQKTLISKGSDYTVTVSYTDDAQIPGNAELAVREIEKDSDEYASYLEQARGAVDETKSVNEARFFDITILADGEKVEPQAPVNVQINFTGIEQTNTDDTQLLHYKDDKKVEVMDKAEFSKSEEQAVDTVQFETDGFSVYGIVSTELVTEFTISNPDGEDVTYLVTVTYGPEANIPEGSTLRVTPFAEGSEDYQRARNAVLADKKEKEEFVDIDDFNLAALDISIIDPNGQEIEPEAAVTVDMTIKELPGVESLEEIKDTLEIQHHVEVPDGVVIEKVFDGSAEGSYEMDTDENIAKEGKAVDPNSVSDDDFRDREAGDTSTDTSFETEVFSTFTITWRQSNANRTTTVHYGYLNGNTFVEFADQPSPVNVTTNNHAYLIYDFDGYQYSGHTYYRTSASTTPASGGTSMRPLLRYNSGWEYRNNNNTNWVDLANNSHVYVVYDKKPEITQGGTPTLKPVNPEDYPEDPSILKESDPNGDGTADLSLSIIGHTKDREVEKLADVIVVFDVSGSMDSNMSGSSRLAVAKNAVNGLVDTLATKKDSQGNPLIRMSLISFSNSAQEEIGLTDLNTSGVASYKSAVNGLDAEGGTNWDYALQLANEQAVDSGRATFVIFVTDGDPTFRNTRMDVNDANLQIYDKGSSDQYYLSHNVFGQGYGTLSENNNSVNFDAAVNQGKAIVGAKKNLYSIGISNSVTAVQNFNTQSGGQGAYLANEASELNQAFDDIAASIIAKLGFSDIQMTDGITEMTQTVDKSGLTTTDGSFTYWKKAKDATGFAEWDPASEGCAEAEYDVTSGAVKWNMGTNFMPEDGATYKVTWKVWPSQEAYDILAQCKNDPSYYDTLTTAQKAQITRTGSNPNYSYSLKTNEPGAGTTYKSATKSGSGITTEGEPKELLFNEVNPLGLASSQIKMKKIWVNELDGREETGTYTFPVKADSTDFGEGVSLSSPNWENSYYISTGLMTTNPYVVYEHGHDYTIEEPESLSYNWDFKSDVYHPMVINNQTVNLIKVDTAAESDYTIDGKYYKALEGEAILTARNERRSNLNISKTVVDKAGNHVESDQAFTFTVTVDEGHDAEVWLSAFDTIAGETVMDSSIVTGTGVQYQESDGYFHAPSGTTLTLTLKDGWNYRFTNLSVGSTYSIEENSPVPSGYTFVNAAATATNGATAGTVTGQKTEGTIDKSNSVYTAAYSNRANTTTLKFRKTDENGTSLAGAVVEIVKDREHIDGSPFTTTTQDIELTLLDGIYRVKETDSPSGYVILNGDMYFKTADGAVTITDQDGNAATYDDFTMDTEDGVIVLKLKNHPGAALPMTGGPGTFLYTLGGIALILASALMYGFRMRRRERRLN